MPFKIRGYMMTKYARHRQVPQSCFDAVDEDLAGKEAIYLERKERRTSLATISG